MQPGVRTELKAANLKLPSEMEAVLLSREYAAKNTVTVNIAVKAKFDFTPGQYVNIRIGKLLKPDARGASRDFSISSAPDIVNEFAITTRISQSGFKETLLNLPPGSQLFVRGPLGNFTLPENHHWHIFLIAGGVGVTPFRSMLLKESKNKDPRRITFFYANSNEASAPFVAELRALSRGGKWLTFIEHYGVPDEEALAKNIVKGFENIYYIAGPPGMVFSVRNILIKKNIASEENIRTEDFTGY